MKIQFLGATGTVTGSKFLLTDGDQRLLIDCGLFQGLKILRLKNWNPLPVEASTIDAVILTHAHLDHSGYLPLLVKNGFSGTIFSTHGSFALCEVLLKDSAHLQEEEAKYLNKHDLSKHKPALPLYSKEDVEQTLPLFKPCDYNDPIQFGEFRFIFRNVSHLLGASFIELSCHGKSITFSGDVGRNNDPLLKEKSPPNTTDYLVLESTYGDSRHSQDNPKELLEKIINDTINRKGIVLIPSFAVGRTQEILFYLHELKLQNRIPHVPIYVNSPMAIKSTHIYEKFTNSLKLSEVQLGKIFQDIHYIETAEQSIELNMKHEPAIILSASGMMTGGRILHHLKAMAPNANNSVVIVGFQAAGTRGEALVRGKREIKIHGEYVPINAQVHIINSLSAHADYQEIIDWIKVLETPPKKTFLVHGEPTASDEMRKHIEQQLNWNCEIAEYLEEYELL